MEIKFEDIEMLINNWTWRDLRWLPEDCIEGYPTDPDNYQCSEEMERALGQVKVLTIDFIRNHFEVLVRIFPRTLISEILWDALADKFDDLGDYGQVDTASREAYMYKIDDLFRKRK